MFILTGLRVMVLATNGVEEMELTAPIRALQNTGAVVDIFSNKLSPIQTVRQREDSIKFSVDAEISVFQARNYDAVVLPGGVMNAKTLGMMPKVQSILLQMDEQNKPIAAIGDGSQELVSADLVYGRNLTSAPDIQDEIRKAGDKWIDQAVVVDRNWVTSRYLSDLPIFICEMLNLFSQRYMPKITPYQVYAMA